MRTSRLLFAALLAAAACGGDDGAPDAPIPDASSPPDAHVARAADYAGLWLITEMDFGDEEPGVIRRDGVPLSLRADALVTPTGDATGTMHVRQLALLQGLPAGEVSGGEQQLTVEAAGTADRWILQTGPEEVAVFDAALAGDRLVLTHDADDPRDTADNPPDTVTCDRVPPWSTTTVGDWELVTITIDGDTIPAETCLEVQAGTTWAMLSMEISIDDRQLFERVMTTRLFSDDTCATQTGAQASTQTGFGEEEDGTTLRMWATEGGDAEFQAFTLALDGDELTLTRTACLPLPECATSAPTEVVVRRAP